jgi:hypothetical protein
VIFLSPLAVFSRDRFLPTNRVVELLFPRLDPVVDVILLAFKTMEFVLFCFVFLFFFFSFFDKKVHLETSGRELLLSFVSLVERMAGLHPFLYFLMPDLRFSTGF